MLGNWKTSCSLIVPICDSFQNQQKKELQYASVTYFSTNKNPPFAKSKRWVEGMKLAFNAS
jgi:hypothetical protein